MVKRLIATLVVVLSCSGCITLVGDSIASQLDTDGFAAIDGSGSRDTDSPGRRPGALPGLDAVRSMAGGLRAGDWMVIELGANDVTNSPSSYIDRVSSLIKAVPPKVCLAFVTAYRSAYEARVRYWNDLVHWFMANRPCGRVVEWYDAVRAHPWYVGSDRLHPTAEGRRVLHDMILDATR